MVAGTQTIAERTARTARTEREQHSPIRELPADLEAYREELTTSAENFADKGYDLEVLSMGERPGFKAFVSSNKEALKALSAMRDEQQVIQHMRKHKVLLEGIAHVRAWYFDRHLAAIKSNRSEMVDVVHEEAAGFFLVDAAADAARSHFFQSQDIKEAAAAGVKMLAMGLSAAGDPVGIRTNMSARVEMWIALVKQAAGASKSKLQAKSKQQLRSSRQRQQQTETAAPSSAATATTKAATTAPTNKLHTITEAENVPEQHELAEPVPPPKAAVASTPPSVVAAPKTPVETVKEDEGLISNLFKGWFGAPPATA